MESPRQDELLGRLMENSNLAPTWLAAWMGGGLNKRTIAPPALSSFNPCPSICQVSSSLYVSGAFLGAASALEPRVSEFVSV